MKAMKALNELIKYAQFIFGGGLGLLANLAVTYVLADIIGLWFRASYAIGLAANVLFNFLYHRHITFGRKDKSMSRLYKFIPLTLAVTATNYILVLTFTELIILKWLMPVSFLQQYYNYMAIVAVTGLVSVINYLANKLWVFRSE